jgi:high-affinity iron transporter
MLSSLIIVFREVIEAGLIVGIVLAATQGVLRRTLWVGYGVAGGVAGACMVAMFADQIGSLFEGSGQELFNAAVLTLAVGMLTWHNVWMSGHGRQMATDMKGVGAEVAAGERSLGLLGGAAVSALIYLGLLAIPPGRLFDATAGLITLLAAGMAAQAVNWLQQSGHFEYLTMPLWNTSWLLSEDSIAGRLLHTLIGYTDQPNGAQLIVYVATILMIVGLMRWEHGRRAAGNAVPRPA